MEIVWTILAIIACVLLFSFAVIIHEFGHFIVAKKLGLKVDAFSVGFGPVLWKKTYNGCEYRISAIPFGGYVALPQVDPEGTKGLEGEGGKKGDVIKDIPAWKAILVAVAGPLGNVVLAVFISCLLAVLPGAKFGQTNTHIDEVIADGPAAKAGMMAGDDVISVGGKPVNTWYEMQVEIQLAGGAATPIEVRRGDSTVTLTVTPEKDGVTGAWFMKAMNTSSKVGSKVMWLPDRNPLKQLAWDAGSIKRVLKALVTPKESKAAANALGGPIAIAEGLYYQVRSNWYEALGFLRFLNVNLAMLNLLPIPVLDGGLILFALFELLTRRKVNAKFSEYVSKCFMYLLIALMLFLVYRDIGRSYRIHKAKAEIEKKAKAEVASKVDELRTNILNKLHTMQTNKAYKVENAQP